MRKTQNKMFLIISAIILAIISAAISLSGCFLPKKAKTPLKIAVVVLGIMGALTTVSSAVVMEILLSKGLKGGRYSDELVSWVRDNFYSVLELILIISAATAVLSILVRLFLKKNKVGQALLLTVSPATILMITSFLSMFTENTNFPVNTFTGLAAMGLSLFLTAFKFPDIKEKNEKGGSSK